MLGGRRAGERWVYSWGTFTFSRCCWVLPTGLTSAIACGYPEFDFVQVAATAGTTGLGGETVGGTPAASGNAGNGGTVAGGGMAGSLGGGGSAGVDMGGGGTAGTASAVGGAAGGADPCAED